MSPGPGRRTATGWQILLLTLLALALRLYHLGTPSLWIDEVSSVEVASQPLVDIIASYQPGRHPWRGSEQAPWTFLVMHPFYTTESIETSARMPFAIIGTLTVPILFLVARQFVAAPTAVLAAALLALSPLHVWYSQEARWYVMWMLLTTLSYGAFPRLMARRSPAAWFAYVTATVFNVYTFILSFLIVVCQGISALLLPASRTERRRRIGTLISATITVMVATLPVLWLMLQTLGLVTGTPRPTLFAQVPYTFFAYVAGYSVGPSVAELHALPDWRTILLDHPEILLYAAVYTPLLCLGVREAWRQRNTATVVLPWAFGPAACVLLLSLISNITYQARYSAAALPAVLIVVALGINGLRRRAARVLAVTTVVAGCAFALGNHFWNPLYTKEDAKGAVRSVQATGQDAPIYVIGQVGPALTFYAGGLRIIELDSCKPAPQRSTLPARIDGELWLAAGRDWNNEAPRCRAHLSDTHREAEERHFPGITLWRYTPQAE